MVRVIVIVLWGKLGEPLWGHARMDALERARGGVGGWGGDNGIPVTAAVSFIP